MTAHIDFSQIITAEDKQVSQREAQSNAARIICHQRIVQIVSESTQVNMSAAAAAGGFGVEDMESYRAILDWITKMRLVWRALAQSGQDVLQDDHWPVFPDDTRQLLSRF